MTTPASIPHRDNQTPPTPKAKTEQSSPTQTELIDSPEHQYTIGEVSAMLGIPATTLRYYDKEQLLPELHRTYSGVRTFTDVDIEWLRYLERLKKSGMPIKEIKRYVELERQGDATIAERKVMVEARRRAVEQQLADLRVTLDFITYKCWFYETASATGSCDTPKNMPDDQLPEYIRRIKKACQIRQY